jgi:hypothetical protein
VTGATAWRKATGRLQRMRVAQAARLFCSGRVCNNADKNPYPKLQAV